MHGAEREFEWVNPIVDDIPDDRESLLLDDDEQPIVSLVLRGLGVAASVLGCLRVVQVVA